MLRSLYTAATGMEAQPLKMDVIANNLANTGTTGFKKVRADFEDLLSETLSGGQAPDPRGGTTSVRLAYIHSLLYALSNPYRFTQRENGDVHALTRMWAGHCELREGRAPAGA